MSSSFTQPAQWRSAVNTASFVSANLRCACDENSSNYVSWKEQMVCLIESQGFNAFIDGGAPAPAPAANDGQDYDAWRRTDRLVKGWILGALSDGVVERVVGLDSARDVWLELEKNFSEVSHRHPHPLRQPPQASKDRNEYLALYKAAISGDWEAAKAFLEQDPDAVKARLDFTLQTVVHAAVSSGKSTSFVGKLVDFISDSSSLALTDAVGYNPLHLAALTGNLPAVKILVQRLPDLLYARGGFSAKLPIHLAAQVAHRQTLEFLISKTRDDQPGHTNPFAGESGLLLLSFMIDASFFDMALALVNKNPDLARIQYSTSALMSIACKDETTFDTGLNTMWERLIYSCGDIITSTTPQKIKGGAENCSPPLWLCTVIKHRVPGMKGIYEKKLMRQQALRFVKCVCKHMESLTYDEATDIYVGPLLKAARSRNQVVVEIIVETFPSAIFSRDGVTKRNFLHLAVQNRCEKVFNLLYQADPNRYIYLLDAVDSDDNTILHLAATLAPPHKLNLVAGAALQMQREIQWFKEVEKFVSPKGQTNEAGKTADMIFTEEHKNLKDEGEKWMKDTANSCTIVAALIVTVVFAATITVPGGNQSDSGNPMFYQETAFTIFGVSVAASLFTSITSLLMFLSILTSRYAEEDFLYALPKRLCIGLVTLFLSIMFMMFASSSTIYLVFGRRKANWVFIPVAAFSCLLVSLFALLKLPLLIAVISSTYGRGIFGKQAHRSFH